MAAVATQRRKKVKTLLMGLQRGKQSRHPKARYPIQSALGALKQLPPRQPRQTASVCLSVMATWFKEQFGILVQCIQIRQIAPQSLIYGLFSVSVCVCVCACVCVYELRVGGGVGVVHRSFPRQTTVIVSTFAELRGLLGKALRWTLQTPYRRRVIPPLHRPPFGPGVDLWLHLVPLAGCWVTWISACSVVWCCFDMSLW